MIHIPISEEFLDEYVVDTLISDLQVVRRSVMMLERREELFPHQQKDLDYDRRLIVSFENLLTYYVPHNEYEERVGSAHPYPLD